MWRRKLSQMIVDFPLPELGDNVASASVIDWHKAVGDDVREGDLLLEVMTEKVNIEVESPLEGRITEILKQVDDEVEPGMIVARIEVAG